MVAYTNLFVVGPPKYAEKEGDDECGPTYRAKYAKDGCPPLEDGVTTCYESFRWVHDI